MQTIKCQPVLPPAKQVVVVQSELRIVHMRQYIVSPTLHRGQSQRSSKGKRLSACQRANMLTVKMLMLSRYIVFWCRHFSLSCQHLVISSNLIGTSLVLQVVGQKNKVLDTSTC